ncbi:hypothetical protein ACOY5P_17685 [Enterobacter asburiae]|uniref:hypothetical protein n=1 Tax=Enterobacterales TaxID=91347 RepID=UPI0013D6C1FF|nr:MULTISPECIES: hypothetical protein [Enterobacterales]
MKRMLFSFFLFSSCSIASECNKSEVLVASCHISGKVFRTAYICADKKGVNGRYVFERNSHVEMSVEFNKSYQLQRWLDKGTYTTYFGFQKSSYSYVIGVPEENFGAKAFLNVKKDGKDVMNKECDSNSFGDKKKNGEYVKDLNDEVVLNGKSIFP